MSESWATPDTVPDHVRRARARSEALRLVCDQVAIRDVVDGVPRLEPSADADPAEWTTWEQANRNGQSERLERVRHILSILEIPAWGWLMRDMWQVLYQRLFPSVLPDAATLAAIEHDFPDDPSTKALLDLATKMPEQLADAPPPALANRMRVDDARARRRFARPVLLVAPARMFLEGWSTDEAHEVITEWADYAHALIDDAAGPNIATTPGKRLGDVERWVGWWYRSEVEHEEISVIARAEFGPSGPSQRRGEIRRRIEEVRELLEDAIE